MMTTHSLVELPPHGGAISVHICSESIGCNPLNNPRTHACRINAAQRMIFDTTIMLEVLLWHIPRTHFVD